jgi:hypothetical protein
MPWQQKNSSFKATNSFLPPDAFGHFDALEKDGADKKSECAKNVFTERTRTGPKGSLLKGG